MKDEFPDLSHKKMNESSETESKSIKIDIDSVEKLISSLSFAAKELEKSVQRVEKNRELSKILDKLSDLKSGDLKNFNKNLEKNLKKVETSVLCKLKGYSEVFKDESIQKTLDEIENIEKFSRKFKFKSLIFATLLSVFVTSFASYFTFYFYFKNQSEKEIKKTKIELSKKYKDIATVFADVNFHIAQNEDMYQIIIKDGGVTIWKNGDEKLINISKK